MSETNMQSSFAAPPKDGGWKEREFHPIPAPDFLSQDWGDEVDWVLEDYLPAGGLVTLAAKPKVGKTTLAYELAVKVAKGDCFLDRRTAQGGVLILALEEHPRDVRLRLQDLGADCANLYVHTGRLEPTPPTFAAIAEFTREHGVKLILVDTLAMFWRLNDECDPSALTQAVKPLLWLARGTGACVLLIHHFRKSEGTEGDQIRGSSALLASVDVALLLHRQGGEKQRRLEGIGRYEETPRELIIELGNAGYTVVGSSAELNEMAEREPLKAALTTVPEDLVTLAKKANVPLRKAYRHMQQLVAEGSAQVHGKGVKGDPFKYSVPLTNALSSNPSPIGQESEMELDEADWVKEVSYKGSGLYPKREPARVSGGQASAEDTLLAATDSGNPTP